MSKHAELHAEPRSMLGKKVRRLRRTGILPATVYGNKVEPQSIQVVAHEFAGVLRHAGRTTLIDLAIADQRPFPVFVKQTTVDAKRHLILHVEFFQANLREQMRSQMPLHFVGESPAVKDGGIFLPVLDHVEIESLPDDVPAGGLEVDIAQLIEIGGAIHAGDLTLPSGVTLVTSADDMVARVNAPIAQETIEETAEAEAPAGETESEQTPDGGASDI